MNFRVARDENEVIAEQQLVWLNVLSLWFLRHKIAEPGGRFSDSASGGGVGIDVERSGSCVTCNGGGAGWVAASTETSIDEEASFSRAV